MKNKSMPKDTVTVTQTQITAVITLTLVVLTVGIFIAALFGNFSL